MFSVIDNKKMKGIGILLLIFHHMYRTVNQIASTGVKLRVLDTLKVSRLATCARICVFIFAFLSAYGLAYIYEHRFASNMNRTINFIILQWLKILFPYWFTLIFLWIIWILVPGLDLMQVYGNGTTGFFYMLGDVFPVLDMLGKGNHMFRGILWYMNYSLLMIVLVPLIYDISKRYGFAIIIITMFLFNYIPVAYKSIYGGDYRYYVFAIEIGILFYLNSTFDKINKVYANLHIICKVILILVLLCLSFVLPYIPWFVINSSNFGYTAMMHTLGAVALIIALFLVRIKQLDKFLVLVGTHSLDIYLTHWLLYYPTFIKIIHVTDILVLQYIWSIILVMGIAIALGAFKKYSGYTFFYSELIAKINK